MVYKLKLSGISKSMAETIDMCVKHAKLELTMNGQDNSAQDCFNYIWSFAKIRNEHRNGLELLSLINQYMYFAPSDKEEQISKTIFISEAARDEIKQIKNKLNKIIDKNFTVTTNNLLYMVYGIYFDNNDTESTWNW